MTTFLIIAGAVVTILGIAAITIILAVIIYVFVLGYPLTLYFERDSDDEPQE